MLQMIGMMLVVVPVDIFCLVVVKGWVIVAMTMTIIVDY